MMSGGGRPKKAAGGEGSPLWVITFADLMSQLMCFFVLILSMSDSDTKTSFKYITRLSDEFSITMPAEKSAAATSKTMIGFENVVGMPQPNIFNFDQSIKKTSDTESNVMSVMDRNFLDGNSGSNIDIELQDTAREIQGILMDEIRDGMIEIIQEDKNIVIRLHDAAVFILHSTAIRNDFYPVLEKIRMILAQLAGTVEIVGYEDDNEIQQTKYNSNWEYSSARASAVADELLKTQELDKNRFLITGYGDTRSVVPNTSDSNREKNRRVEVIIHQGSNKPISFDKQHMPLGANPIFAPNTPLNHQPASEKTDLQQRGAP
jgi:chemotaxis protein MotB